MSTLRVLFGAAPLAYRFAHGQLVDEMKTARRRKLAAQLIAVEIALLCLSLGVIFVIENPLTSMMWSFPPMVKLWQTAGVRLFTLDYCMFGKDWKKSTSVAANWDFSPLERRCHGTMGCC